MDKQSFSFRTILSKGYLALLSAGNIIFSTLSSLIYIYLLEFDQILRSRNRHIESKREGPKREHTILLPTNLPDRLALPLMNRLGTLDSPAGRISILKNSTFSQSLAEWRDLFIKDMYISIMRTSFNLRTSGTTQFIHHKLGILRENWFQVEAQNVLSGGVHAGLFGVFLEDMSEEQAARLWDWRLAYRTENPDREVPDTEVMDRVERYFPNFGDKVLVRPEHRSRGMRDSGIPEKPNWTTKEEYNDPELWEGVVINVRNSGDAFFKVRMKRLFVRCVLSEAATAIEDGEDDLCNVLIQGPITLFDGLGPVSEEDRAAVRSFIFEEPLYNLYGWLNQVQATDYESDDDLEDNDSFTDLRR